MRRTLLRRAGLLATLLALILGALPAARAQPGAAPTLVRPDLAPPLPPELALAAAAAPSPAQATTTCAQVLADPGVEEPAGSTPWTEYRAARLISTEQPFAGSQSIAFVEDSDGNPPSGPDSDATGQVISLPGTLEGIVFQLRHRFASGSTGPGDQLRLELYRVGQINAGGLLAGLTIDAADLDTGSWQLFDGDIFDPVAIAQLRAAGQAAFVISSVNVANGLTQRVWLDDIQLQICTPRATISGQVRQSAAASPNLADARLLLTRSDAGGTSVVAAGFPDASGAYRFSGLEPLPTGASYRVWFINIDRDGDRDEGRLSFWAGPVIRDLLAGEQRGGQNFDISGVRLLSPASYSAPAASNLQPVSLTWASRGVAGDRHQLCIYDPQLVDPSTGQPAQACGPVLDPATSDLRFNLAPASFAPLPQFGFQYGRDYRWYVVVYDRAPASNPDAQYGYSFFERAIRPLPAAAQPPAAAVQPVTSDPGPAISGAEWTLMVYAAGDNALGDPARSSGLALLTNQLAALATRAPTAPRVNILTLQDGYGDTGVSICLYRPSGGPDCRQRAELNTADPLTLASFVRLGLERYPAQRSMLLIVSPGQALGGLAYDETASGQPIMAIEQFGQALSAAGLGGAQKLDIILFQAPLLGSIHAAGVVEPYARYMVASPGQIWQVSLAAGILETLGAANNSQVAQVAAGLVNAYNTSIASYGPGRTRSMAAYDLSRIPALATQVDELGEAILAALDNQSLNTRQILAEAQATTQAYDSSGNGLIDASRTSSLNVVPIEEDSMLDLRDLADQIAGAAGIDPAIAERAEAIRSLLVGNSSPVIARALVSGLGRGNVVNDLSRASGIGILMPNDERSGDQTTIRNQLLYGTGAADPWPTMLRAYLDQRTLRGPGGVTADASGSAALLYPQTGYQFGTRLLLPLVRR